MTKAGLSKTVILVYLDCLGANLIATGIRQQP